MRKLKSFQYFFLPFLQGAEFTYYTVTKLANGKYAAKYFKKFILMMLRLWGYSSVGRVSGSHPEGRGFDSLYLHS